MRIHIDFETRSKVDIKKSGGGRYCTDPSTRILCYAYAVDDGPVKLVGHGKYPEEFDTFIEKDATFVAHNAYFEAMIWKHVWKREPPKFQCTMSKACAHGLPWKLQKLTLALGLPEQKHLEGMRLIKRFSVPNIHGQFNDPKVFPEDWKAFKEYCKQDVIVERQVDKILPDLTKREQKIFNLTLQINDRGMAMDSKLAQNALEIFDALMKKCNDEVALITKGEILSITQTMRIKRWILEKYDIPLDGLSSDDIEGCMVNYDLPPKLHRLLELRSEFGRSSVAKFKRTVDASCDDGRIRNYLIYHGASTGRWTSQTVQFQNLPRGVNIDQNLCIELIKQKDSEVFDLLYSKPVSALATCIRGLIVAPPEKTLLVADYAAIEARVLMWVVGQKDAVKLFHDNRDIYVEMAKVIHSNPNLTKKDKDERQLGKQAVLGCGYQMGPGRFRLTCEGYGILIDEKLAKLAVESYRDTYKCVPQFWADVERAAFQTVRSKRAHHCGPITFFIKGKFLYCRLPSGRDLAYYRPGFEEKEMPWGKSKNCLYYYTVHSETKSFKKTFTYGGKLTENIIQAIARDIMAYAMLRLEKENFPVVLSVHDEIICEVNNNSLHFTIEHMNEIMCKLPKWAEGCPIDAEGWKGTRYRK